MLNIPTSIKSLFERDSVQKNFRAHFVNGERPDITNADVVAESVIFTETVCSQNVFKFGTTESPTLEFETVGVENILGMQIEAGIEINASTLTAAEVAEITGGTFDGVYVAADQSDTGWPYYRMPYGRFTVASCPRNHENMAHRRITAYGLAGYIYTPGDHAAPSEIFTIHYDTIKTAVTENPQTWSTATRMPNTSDTDEENAYISQANATGRSTIHAGVFSNGIKPAVKWAKYHIPLNYGVADPMPELAVYVSGVADPKFEAIAKEAFEQITAVTRVKNYDGYRWEKIDDFFPYIAYSNTKTAMAVRLGGFQPYYYFTFDKGEYTQEVYYTLPQRFELNEPFVISMANAVDAVTMKRTNMVTGDTGPFHDLYLCIPYYVEGTEYGRPGIVEGFATNYRASSWPTAQAVERAEASSIQVKYKKMTYTDQPNMEFKTGVKNVLDNMGTFYDFEDKNAINSAMWEIQGGFAKRDRTSEKTKVIKLSTASTANVSAAEYSELWWDEYDVDPVGKVLYKNSADEEKTLVIGAGTSVYDAKENAILSHTTTSAYAQTIIKNELKPAATTLNFSPFEMTMQGRPQIEAGDKIVIETPEGNLTSYVLQHVVRGIQMLQSEIQATSGELVGMVVD